MTITEKVRDYVEAECRKPESHYGYEPFPFHFVPMVGYSRQLAERLGADVEIVELASWLHDIGAIVYGRENHHQTGAEIARKKLTEFGYPSEKIELVCQCILNHRGSVDNTRESLEEKIVAEADVLSNFDNISGIFKAAFVFESLSQDAAQKSVFEKMTRKYNKLHFEESKEIIQPKYEAVKLLLG